MTRFGKALAFCAAAGLAATAPLSASDRPSGEERLAKMLEGRTAGEPKSCINMFGSDSLTVIDKTALVYQAGGKIWVNRTANPDSIDDNDVLIIKKFGTSGLCRTDSITLADRSSGMFSGVLFLEDFVPYEKTES